jgi:hypothetical protein
LTIEAYCHEEEKINSESATRLMEKIRLQLIRLSIAITVISCKQNTEVSSLRQEDVYVAGVQYIGAEHWAATYWKNGNPTFLTDGTKDAAAYAITLNGRDIYVAGEEDHCLKYWKNGIEFVLTSKQDEHSSRANGITVVGDDVYVAGYIANTSGIKVAAIWKNRTVIELSDGINDAMANSVAVLNNDVYVVGNENIGVSNKLPLKLFQSIRKTVAVYWKNGTLNTLTDGQYDASAESITIADSNMYISGNEFIDKHHNRYWKNGRVTGLSEEFKKVLSWRLHYVVEKTIPESFVLKNGKALPPFDAPSNGTRYFFDLFVVSK